MKVLLPLVLGLVLVPPSFGAADSRSSGTLLLGSCKAAEATQDATAKGGSAVPEREYAHPGTVVDPAQSVGPMSWSSAGDLLKEETCT